MVKQLTEQELRAQAVRVLSDNLGPVDALRFLASVSRSLSTIKNGDENIFRHTMWMNCWKKSASITPSKVS